MKTKKVELEIIDFGSLSELEQQGLIMKSAMLQNKGDDESIIEMIKIMLSVYYK